MGGKEEQEDVAHRSGIAVAIPVDDDPTYNKYKPHEFETSEDLDPTLVHQQIKSATERGHMQRDIEIERDWLAQRLALQKQEMEMQTSIATGQSQAYIRNRQGFTVTCDNEREEEEYRKLLQQREFEKAQSNATRRVTYSNVPGGGYDVQPYQGITYDESNYQYDSRYEYKSVYEE